MLDVAGLIEKHKGKGVLVDANLLVLLVVGNVNRNRIATFKRTQSFTTEDFDFLRALIAHFGPRLVTTPHVLSQVSDLSDLKGHERVQIRALLKTLVENAQEHYDAATSLVSHALFERLGLAGTWHRVAQFQSCAAPGMEVAHRERYL